MFIILITSKNIHYLNKITLYLTIFVKFCLYLFSDKIIYLTATKRAVFVEKRS